jgi:assimilatory nitrate reductase catalytic subunit
MGTNPAVSLPEVHKTRAAFRKLDLFVVSENVAATDTLGCGAHIRLPAQAWGEKDGTVTNSERRISRQRRFLVPIGEAKPDWWAVSEVARRLGFAGFDYADASEIFVEHAALSAFENDGGRDFDLSGLTHIARSDYDDFKPVQWPVRPGQPPQMRFFSEGGFYTGSSKAQFIAVAAPQLAEPTSNAYPLLLNTGRIRDQWHTMTRTGLSQRLGSHITEPFVSVHPSDAARFSLTDGGLARLSNGYGSATYRVVVTKAQQRGSVFTPIHWTDETASDGRTGSLVHAMTDPFSGQPDLKATPVAIAPVEVALSGFILARHRFPLPRDSFWAWSAIGDGYVARFDTPGDGSDLVAALESSVGPAERLRYEDRAKGIRRLAFIREDRLVGVYFQAPVADAPKWSVVAEAWASPRLESRQRRLLLSGKRLDGQADEGPNVCACFGVPHNRIVAAIAEGATSATAVGSKLKAGTNCGSCLPEIKRLIAESAAAASKLQHVSS